MSSLQALPNTEKQQPKKKARPNIQVDTIKILTESKNSNRSKNSNKVEPSPKEETVSGIEKFMHGRNDF